jgi:hypothetical protein
MQVEYKNHVCGENSKWCKNCHMSVELEHKCFIKAEQNDKKLRKVNSYIFFDFETYIDETTNKHVVNLALAQKICSKCVDELDSTKRCNDCKKRHSFDNISNFTKWILKQKRSTIIAHNFKAFDGIFLLKNFLDNVLPTDSKNTVSVINNGNKIISMKFRSLTFLDSHCFIPSSLASFSKTFEIEELRKGFFPHLFNKMENFNYIGSYPTSDYYQPDLMSNEKRAEFFSWYNINKTKIFDFKKELNEYCWSDVRLLTEGCLIFRKINMENTKKNSNDKGVDPFCSSFTIASYCNYIFRRNFMKDNSIGLIPSNGYNPKQNTSNKANEWLNYLSIKEKIHIQSNLTGGEKRCGRYYLDGYCESNRTIYEFLGCYWHGCQQCYTPTTFNPVRQNSMKKIYNQTMYRLKKIQQMRPNDKLVYIWEHDWNSKRKNEEVIQIIKTFNNNADELKIRNCLYGGRTNAIKLYYKCKNNEYISYIDVTSLYPFVQKYKRYPVGHPIILRSNFDLHLKRFKKFFGFMKCRILAPKGLYLGVLPTRLNGKLVFPLCQKCAIDSNKTPFCNHSENERALQGEWCTEEIELALKHGYKLQTINEVWHWCESEEYDVINKKGGLFTEYINQAIKEKQEASGYPAECLTDDAKENYINNYFLNEGILLDKNNIKKNSGRRMISKLKANSQWGYLALNTNKIQFKIIRDRATWVKMLEDDQHIIHNVELIESKSPYVQVFYSFNDEFHLGDNKTNVALAAFVTTYARIHLYNELFKLGDRVLYFDTDSIIYVTRDNDNYQPELGNNLGQWTNEISADDGHYIDEFVSAGPKNYAYKTKNGTTDCTIKGFNMNYLTSLKITFDSIKEIVCENPKKKISTKQLQFKINRSDWSIETLINEKNYGFVYDKRVLLADLSTYPFGYY